MGQNESKKKKTVEQKEEVRLPKVLIMGTSDDGRTKIWNQFRTWSNNYEKDIGATISQLRDNVQEAMRLLIEQSIRLSDVIPSAAILPENREIQRELTSEYSELDYAESVPIIEKLWRDPGIQKTWENRGNFEHMASTPYYMKRMHDYKVRGCPLTKEDCLHVRPTGLVCGTKTQYENELFELYLMRGDLRYRRNWIHTFHDAVAIIFVISLAEYNLIHEDTQKNRMYSSLRSWNWLLSKSPLFKIPIYLCLDQMDVFLEKLHDYPLSVNFPDYKPDTDDIVKAVMILEYVLPSVLVQLIISYVSPSSYSALNYIKSQYLAEVGERDLTVYETIALDRTTLAPLVNDVMAKIKISRTKEKVAKALRPMMAF